MTDDPNRREEERLDFTALHDAERFETLVGRIRQAATPELLRRQNRLTLWGTFARWRRAIMVASSALALASVLVLVLIQPTTVTESGFAESLGIPQQWAEWIESGENPGPADLLDLERGQR